jgi:hypothetical protein
MPLHRDIFWVGKQWSVTGDGMQAIDQKLKGKFDIEVSRLWDDDLAEDMQDKKWFDLADFNKGLSVARKHYPQPRRKAESAKAESSKDEPAKAKPVKAAPVLVVPPSSSPDDPVAVKDQPKADPAPAPVNFAVRAEAVGAKFLQTWRIRVRAPG